MLFFSLFFPSYLFKYLNLMLLKLEDEILRLNSTLANKEIEVIISQSALFSLFFFSTIYISLSDDAQA